MTCRAYGSGISPVPKDSRTRPRVVRMDSRKVTSRDERRCSECGELFWHANHARANGLGHFPHTKAPLLAEAKATPQRAAETVTGVGEFEEEDDDE